MQQQAAVVQLVVTGKHYQRDRSMGAKRYVHRFTKTKTCIVYYSVQFQKEYDPYDGQQPGYYAWCSSDPEGGSYFSLGPYETEEELHEKVPTRLERM